MPPASSTESTGIADTVVVGTGEAVVAATVVVVLVTVVGAAAVVVAAGVVVCVFPAQEVKTSVNTRNIIRMTIDFFNNIMGLRGFIPEQAKRQMRGSREARPKIIYRLFPDGNQNMGWISVFFTITFRYSGLIKEVIKRGLFFNFVGGAKVPTVSKKNDYDPKSMAVKEPVPKVFIGFPGVSISSHQFDYLIIYTG
jgi:hypothetical protein